MNIHYAVLSCVELDSEQLPLLSLSLSIIVLTFRQVLTTPFITTLNLLFILLYKRYSTFTESKEAYFLQLVFEECFH